MTSTPLSLSLSQSLGLNYNRWQAWVRWPEAWGGRFTNYWQPGIFGWLDRNRIRLQAAGWRQDTIAQLIVEDRWAGRALRRDIECHGEGDYMARGAQGGLRGLRDTVEALMEEIAFAGSAAEGFEAADIGQPNWAEELHELFARLGEGLHSVLLIEPARGASAEWPEEVAKGLWRRFNMNAEEQLPLRRLNWSSEPEAYFGTQEALGELELAGGGVLFIRNGTGGHLRASVLSGLLATCRTGAIKRTDGSRGKANCYLVLSSYACPCGQLNCVCQGATRVRRIFYDRLHSIMCCMDAVIQL